jgi:hypothetical protein
MEIVSAIRGDDWRYNGSEMKPLRLDGVSPYQKWPTAFKV